MTEKIPLPPPRKAPSVPKKAPPVTTTRPETTKVPNKTFSIKRWEGDKEGEKIIIYADSGMGKTTLSAMAPSPAFIPIDDGSRKVLHPITGEELFHVEGVETFDDYRSVLQQPDLFKGFDTIITDTSTLVEDLALDWTLANVPHESGSYVNRIEGYGWGKGYRHLYDTMKLPLADMDQLIRRGKNIVLICQLNQIEVANASGSDYLKEIPKLSPSHGKGTPSVWSAYVEWADHVFRIGYETVQAKGGKATAGNNRAIFVHPEIYYTAKSRGPKLRECPIISFNSPDDDSLWKFLFPERYV